MEVYKIIFKLIGTSIKLLNSWDGNVCELIVLFRCCQYSHLLQFQQPVNPKPFLADLIGKQVAVKLKWRGQEYRGILKSVDTFMNIQVGNSEFLKHFNYLYSKKN